MIYRPMRTLGTWRIPRSGAAAPGAVGHNGSMNPANATALRNLIAQRDALLKGGRRPLTPGERVELRDLARRIAALTAIMATT